MRSGWEVVVGEEAAEGAQVEEQVEAGRPAVDQNAGLCSPG